MENNKSTIDRLLENSKYGVFTYPEMRIDIIDRFRNTCYFERTYDETIDEDSVFVPYSMLTQVIEAYEDDLEDMDSFVRIDVQTKEMWTLAEDLVSFYRDSHKSHPCTCPAKFKNAIPLYDVYNKGPVTTRVHHKPKKESLDVLLHKCKESSYTPYERSYNLKMFMDLPVLLTFDTLADGNYARSYKFEPLKKAFVDFYNERKLLKHFRYYRIKDVLCDLLFDDYHRNDPDEMNYRYFLICMLLYDVVLFDRRTNDEAYGFDRNIEELNIENAANDSIIPMKGDFI